MPGALVAPAVSPPVNETKTNQAPCVRFQARACNATKASQRWTLLPGVKPGDGQPTTVKSAVKRNATCMQVENGAKISVNFDSNTNGAHGGCKSKLAGPDGCKSLPHANGFNGSNYCDYDQAFVFNANGTVALWNTRTIHDNEMTYTHQCMQIDAKDDSVGMGKCIGPLMTATMGAEPKAKDTSAQVWETVTNTDGAHTQPKPLSTNPRRPKPQALRCSSCCPLHFLPSLFVEWRSAAHFVGFCVP